MIRPRPPSFTTGIVHAVLTNSIIATETLTTTEDSAREAARIRRELRASERSLGTADMLVAADARRIGATLVTADGDFGAVDGLSVATFR